MFRACRSRSRSHSHSSVSKDCRPFESYEHDHPWLFPRIGVLVSAAISELLRERCWQSFLSCVLRTVFRDCRIQMIPALSGTRLGVSSIAPIWTLYRSGKRGTPLGPRL